MNSSKLNQRLFNDFPSESEVRSSWTTSDFEANILCATYRHAPYLQDALRGFVTQKTTFPFKIILRDDASDDGTDDIVKAFKERYPNICSVILEPENTFPARRPANELMKRASGKYIAFCEGDDFWVYPYKLQRQIEALEANREAAMSTHETFKRHYPRDSARSFRRMVSIVYRDSQLYGIGKSYEVLIDAIFNRERFWSHERSHMDQKRRTFYNLNDLSNGRWCMAFCSIVMRRSLVDPIPDCYTTGAGGHQLTLLLGAMNGGIIHSKDCWAVKRDQESSVTLNKKRKEQLAAINARRDTNLHIKRYECLKKYANEEQKRILDGMIKDFVVKHNLR